MIINQALGWATKKLQAKKITTASLDAEVLLSFILKKSKEFLYTFPKKVLTLRQAQELKLLVSRRAKFEPVAYLTNHKEFYGLDFMVNKNVFIPRPETELLVEEVLSYLANRQSQITKSDKHLAICDVGTGSGCIAITLAKNLPQATIYATDISKKALKVAKKNAKKHQVKINFFQGNLLQPLDNKRIDIIVANLPYLSKEVYPQYAPLGIKYEPKKALISSLKEIDELAIYKKFFQQINSYPKILRVLKKIIIEIHYSQLSWAKKLIKKYLPKTVIEVKKDLTGFHRVLLIKLK